MFGYITICKESLSAEGVDTFRAYYCGLCRATGRRCSQAARMGLSYDITFLALVLSSLSKDGERCTHRCAVKAFKKCPCMENDAAVDYAADMGVLLAYLKLADDWHDDRSIKAFIKSLFIRRAAKKAMRRHPRVSGEIQRLLTLLAAKEKEMCAEIDETADCFAKILEILFTPDFITDKPQRRALAWLGYNIGRWIYIIDAYADIESDTKKKNYNTFVCANGGFTAEEIKTKARETLNLSLTFTLENATSAYNLLNIKRNHEVAENILFKALKLKQDAILGV